MASVYDRDIPQPLQNISCQDLLRAENTYSGWLRKRHFVNKLEIFNWPKVYVILSKGCIYYFKNEYSHKSLGKFSFYGYNSVTRSKIIAPKQGPWAFQVVHTHKEFKTYYFAAPSEREMKEWMKQVKGTLVDANGKSTEYYTYRQAAEASKNKLIDDESVTYNEIETNIYGDVPSFTLGQDYKAKYKIKMENEASDDEDDVPSEPATRPPDLPPPRERPPQPLPNMSAIGTALPVIPGPSFNSHTRGPLPATPEDPPALPARKDNIETKGQQKRKKTSNEMQNGRKGSDPSPYEKAKTPEPEPGPEPKPEPEPQRTVNERVSGHEQDQEDEGSYWDDIHFHDTDPERASEIIRKLETEGTFLVRDGRKGKVLLVYAANSLKKYQIMQDKDQFFLKRDGPHADSLEELMYEYHMKNIPNCDVKLVQPYLHHPSYKNIK